MPMLTMPNSLDYPRVLTQIKQNCAILLSIYRDKHMSGNFSQGP